MENQESEIRIYVACLAAYNNGVLHGAWIDADQTEEDIFDAIKAILKASPIPNAEEWAIHDYEGFEGVQLSEYSGIQYVSELAAFISEHGALGAELLNEFHNIDDAKNALENQYAGTYAKLSEFAQEITENSQTIPDSLQYYIDWESMARDLEVNDVFTVETGFEQIHVFWRV